MCKGNCTPSLPTMSRLFISVRLFQKCLSWPHAREIPRRDFNLYPSRRQSARSVTLFKEPDSNLQKRPGARAAQPRTQRLRRRESHLHAARPPVGAILISISKMCHVPKCPPSESRSLLPQEQYPAAGMIPGHPPPSRIFPEGSARQLSGCAALLPFGTEGLKVWLL